MIALRPLALALVLFIATPWRAAASERDAEILYKQARAMVDADSAVTLYKIVVDRFPRDTISAWAFLRLAQYSAARGEQALLEKYVSRLREIYPKTQARREAAALMPERKPETTAEQIATRNAIKQARAEAAATKRADAPPAAPKRETSSPAAPAERWTVQMGAFGVKANADRMRKMAAETYPTTIVERQRGAAILYCVTSGSFVSKEAAERAIDALEKSTGTKGVVVKQ